MTTLIILASIALIASITAIVFVVKLMEDRDRLRKDLNEYIEKFFDEKSSTSSRFLALEQIKKRIDFLDNQLGVVFFMGTPMIAGGNLTIKQIQERIQAMEEHLGIEFKVTTVRERYEKNEKWELEQKEAK